MQGRRVVVVGLRDELAAVGSGDLLRRFGLTEVERIAFPSHGDWSLAANKGILESSGQSLGRCARTTAPKRSFWRCAGTIRGASS